MSTLQLGTESVPLHDPNQEYAAVIKQQRIARLAWLELPGGRGSHIHFWSDDGYGGEEFWHGEPADLGRRNQQLARLRGGLVLDLGCGKDWRQFKGFLTPFGIKGYIGVDDIWGGVSKDGTVHGINVLDTVTDQHEPPALRIQGDMLEVLSRLPSDSFSVAINGIDDLILPSHDPYAEAVVTEVARVTSSRGLIFGITLGGGILTELSALPGFTSTTLRRRSDYDVDPYRGFNFIVKDTQAVV